MARYSIDGQILTDVADAIREKTGYEGETVSVIASTSGALADGSVYNDGSGNYAASTYYTEIVKIPYAEQITVNIAYSTSSSLGTKLYIIPGAEWDGVGDLPSDATFLSTYQSKHNETFDTNTITFVYYTGDYPDKDNQGYYATVTSKVVVGMTPEEMAEGIRSIEVGGDGLADAIIARTITEYTNPDLTAIGDYTFYQCKSFKKIDCPNVTSIGDYALSQTALSEVNFPLVKTIGEYAFEAGSSSPGTLVSVNLPVATTVEAYAFRYQILENITLPAVTKMDGYRVFEGCKSLVKADLGPVAKIDRYCFSNCSKLTALILRKSTMTTLGNTNVLTSTPIASGTGYIYVPSALIDSYKTATNWTTYANQFRAIEDYPDICG